MKKLFAIVTICLITTAAMAQGGDRRAQMMAAQKQKLVDSLGVTSAIADSIQAVQMSYMMKQRDIRGDGQTPPTDDQKMQMQKMRDEMKTRLKAYLTEDQISKLEAMQMAQRGMGMGGGRRGGNTPPPPPPTQQQP